MLKERYFFNEKQEHKRNINQAAFGSRRFKIVNSLKGIHFYNTISANELNSW